MIVDFGLCIFTSEQRPALFFFSLCVGDRISPNFTAF